MKQILLFVAIVLLFGLGFAWLADRPGQVSIEWQGQLIETSLMAATVMLAAIVVSLMFAWWVINLILNSPAIMSRFFKNRRKDRGYKALSRGLVAAGAGDVVTARQMMKKSGGLLKSDDEPLVQLLAVQAAMIDKRYDDAHQTLDQMANNPETSALGLRGLYLEAKRVQANDAARDYAKRAATQAPTLAWANEAAIEYHGQDGDWDDAIRILERQISAGSIEKEAGKRKKAVILTGRAMSRDEGEQNLIQNDAKMALGLVPDFVPAALVGAKSLFRMDKLRAGTRMLEKVWKLEPHPQIAEIYVNARGSDTNAERLKRAKRLESLRQNHVESLFCVAQAALEAREFSLAREKAEAAARLEARESIYLLLADIEEAETSDQGRVRHWLSNAVRAPKDHNWVADGIVSEDWAPMSPVTGKLDAFEWKLPVTTLSGPNIDGQRDADRVFDDAVAALPPIVAASTIDQTDPQESALEDVSGNVPEDVIETVVSDNTDESDDNALQTDQVNGSEILDEDTISEQSGDELSEDEKAEAQNQDVLSRRVDDPGIDPDAKDAEASPKFKLF